MDNPFSGIIPKNDKRIIIFVRKIGGVYTKISSRKIAPHKSKVNFRELAYEFDINKPSFRNKNRFMYVVDVKEGQLFFHESKQKVSAELMDTILGKSIVKQIVSAMENPPLWNNFILILAILGLGLAGGYIIGNFVPMG